MFNNKTLSSAIENVMPSQKEIVFVYNATSRTVECRSGSRVSMIDMGLSGSSIVSAVYSMMAVEHPILAEAYKEGVQEGVQKESFWNPSNRKVAFDDLDDTSPANNSMN